ncbi:hypothetical protein KSP35_05500 [Aquihabitans sp. G128]|uniref:hypothetical protein n=1 Tax=Aquihabitans sp. G128 TaxID=2849779 RepID=UPI001C225400|nr:hypothetical protein [Aquihabitans sp. G128]QXC62262.1 hypothetical protein KSP35_05500 [Aquihabitans sp. G128]
MVILLSALAVVVAAILIVTWFVVGGGFALIYAAMALAVVSMLLLWAARWIGSTPEEAGRDEPEPLRELASGAAPAADAEDAWDQRPEEVEPAAAASSTEPVEAAAVEEPDTAEPVVTEGSTVAEEPAVERQASRAARVAASTPAARVEHAADGPGDGLPVFPIAEYDTLWVSQIVPLLAQLEPDELSVVEARERGGRHRAAVLDAIAAHREGRPVPPPAPRRSSRDVAADADGPAGADAAPAAAAEAVSLDIDDAELAEEEARWAAWSEVDPGPSADDGLDLDDEGGSKAGDDELFAELPDDGPAPAAVEVDEWHLPEADAVDGEEGEDVDDGPSLTLDDDVAPGVAAPHEEPAEAPGTVHGADLVLEDEPEDADAPLAPAPGAADDEDDLFVAEVPDLDLGDLDEPAAPSAHHAPHPAEDLEGDPDLFDWTLPEPDVDPAAPSVDTSEVDRPDVAPVAITGPDDEGWDADEPSAWDWSGVRHDGAEPEQAAAADGDERDGDGGAAAEGDGVARVRTFLGRRRSSVTIQD